MVAVAWTAIGLLAAALFYLGTRIDALGARLDGRINALDGRIDALGTDLRTEIRSLATKLDAHLADHSR